MRLFTSKRIRDIFIQVSQGGVTQATLAQQMKVSTRTIRSDLKELSEIVTRYGNRLVSDRKHGLSIAVVDRAGLSQLLEQSQQPWQTTRCAAGRRQALLTALLRQKERVSLAVLEASWYISIYSLRNDVAVLKRQLAVYRIAIHCGGNDELSLAGDEVALRRCIYDLLLQAKDPEQAFQQLFSASLKIADVKQALSHYFDERELILSDVNLRFFTIACAVATERSRLGHGVADGRFALPDAPWQQMAVEVAGTLADAAVANGGEISWLALHLAAFCSTVPLSAGVERYVAEQAVMDHFLSYISASWFCELSYDQPSRDNLLRHITAMRIRVNNGITLINPLIEQIKRHYPLIYEMTLAAFSELDLWFSGRISDDEIGYLVMHIGAILEETQSREGDSPVTALLVSDQGVAATRLVCQKIVRMYPNITISGSLSVSQYLRLPQAEVDLVIALADVGEKHHRTITLSPLPERGELESIRQLLSPGRQPPETMSNWFSAQHFAIYRGEEHCKASLIALMAGDLQASGRVDAGYLDSVSERESRASTLLDDKIAIPHPMGLVALSTVVSVALFPDGIEWDEGKTVRLVFMLAISGDAFIDSMLIYDYLTNILDDEVIAQLSQSDSFAEFISRSEKYFL